MAEIKDTKRSDIDEESKNTQTSLKDQKTQTPMVKTDREIEKNSFQRRSSVFLGLTWKTWRP